MRGVEYRPAQEADLAVLVAMLADEDFFADRLARQQAGKGVLLTAWIENVPVGVVYLWREPADEREVRQHLPRVPLLNHIEVHADYRNQGIGTELVSVAEKMLVEDGCDRVALAVRTDNNRARKLYERLGYEKWPYPAVECLYEVRLPDGSRKSCTEICDMLVRSLRDSSA